MSRKKPRDEINERLVTIRQHLKKHSLQGFVVSDPIHARYLSGYMGDDTYLFIAKRKQYLLTDSRYTEQAGEEAPDFEIVQRKKSLQAEVGRLARKHNAGKVAYEPHSLLVPQLKKLRKELKGIKLKSSGDLVRKMRQVKTSRELTLITDCIEIAQKAFKKTRRAIKQGKSERVIGARLTFEMRKLGADAEAFPSIVAVGPRGSLPHARCTDKPAKVGSPVLIDWGAARERYNCDLTRTLVPSKIPSRLKKIYEIVLEAQKRGIDASGPGVKASNVDKAVRDYIKGKGYGKRFEHSTGHGVGMAVHEGPGIGAKSKDTLKPGMVFTIEPGIYIPGWGGVRIEDMVMITDNGREVLTSVPKDIDKTSCPKL